MLPRSEASTGQEHHRDASWAGEPVSDRSSLGGVLKRELEELRGEGREDGYLVIECEPSVLPVMEDVIDVLGCVRRPPEELREQKW